MDGVGFEGRKVAGTANGLNPTKRETSIILITLFLLRFVDFP